jgi:hypothetical protein
MGSTYAGKVANVTGALPGGVAIASSTNTNPIVITTTGAHGLVDQTTVDVTNHAINTRANGQWVATVLSPTTFSIPTPGNGVGAATGQVQSLAPGAAATILGDGDAGSAANFNNPSIASLDKGAFFAAATGASKVTQIIEIATIDGTFNFGPWLGFVFTAANTPVVITSALFTIPNVNSLDNLLLNFSGYLTAIPQATQQVGIGLQVTFKAIGGATLGTARAGATSVSANGLIGAACPINCTGFFSIGSLGSGGIVGGTAVVDLFAFSSINSGGGNTLHMNGDWSLNGIVYRNTFMPQ